MNAPCDRSQIRFSRRSRTTLAVVLAGLVLIVCAVVPAQAVTPISGYWAGDVTEEEIIYPVRLYIGGNLNRRPAGKTNYPTWPCKGKLTFKRKKNGRYFFKEKLTSGRANCVNGGTVRVNRTGQRLRFRWDKAGDDYAAAKGVLDRES